MKLVFALIFSVLVLMPLSCQAADSGVSLSATVVGPPTLNDFDLSGINPDAKPIGDRGTVLGATTQKDYSSQIIGLELGAVFLAVLFSLFIKRKRRFRTKLGQKLANNPV